MKFSKAAMVVGGDVAVWHRIVSMWKWRRQLKQGSEILLWSSTTGPDGEKIKRRLTNTMRRIRFQSEISSIQGGLPSPQN